MLNPLHRLFQNYSLKKTFNKDEKLKSRSIIDRLFKRGNPEVQTFYGFPFRVLYLIDQTSDVERLIDPLAQVEGSSETGSLLAHSPPQVLFSVSKRNFKRAVDRNLIRRRCREAYRLHKHLLTENPQALRVSHVAFLYLAKEISRYDVIEKSMVKTLQKMASPPSH